MCRGNRSVWHAAIGHAHKNSATDEIGGIYLKKHAVWAILLLFLSGCSLSKDDMETGMELRSSLLQASGCSFEAEIIADYGDKIHIFAMQCVSDSSGDLNFTVTEPESISGITGKLTSDGGQLTFDETALHFELLAEAQLSPISAPWILLKTLRSGYMSSACREEGKVRISIDDSFQEEPLRLDVWLDQDKKPEQGDILYDGRRILSVSVENFEFL